MRKTKQYNTERTTLSSELRLFHETKNLRNSVPSHSVEGRMKGGGEVGVVEAEGAEWERGNE
jgi:hypothetical protein